MNYKNQTEIFMLKTTLVTYGVFGLQYTNPKESITK